MPSSVHTHKTDRTPDRPSPTQEAGKWHVCSVTKSVAFYYEKLARGIKKKRRGPGAGVFSPRPHTPSKGSLSFRSIQHRPLLLLLVPPSHFSSPLIRRGRRQCRSMAQHNSRSLYLFIPKTPRAGSSPLLSSHFFPPPLNCGPPPPSSPSFLKFESGATEMVRPAFCRFMQ